MYGQNTNLAVSTVLTLVSGPPDLCVLPTNGVQTLANHTFEGPVKNQV